ncbi:hypothetical protein [Rhodospirillaceae bacterium SYSU D60014]|uniref:hypothetical protein n=1 Tax=Virgifigura deserti TaxID=2268457 RepID=UPI000E668B49
MRLLGAFFCAALLSGCFATTAGYRQLISGWVGHTEQRLVSAWGVPDSVYTSNDGSKVLRYYDEYTYQTGGNTTYEPITTHDSGKATVYEDGDRTVSKYTDTTTTYVPVTTPVVTHRKSCETQFTISPSGIVTAFSFNGNDCRAVEE